MLYAVPVGATIANGDGDSDRYRPRPSRCRACAPSSSAANLGPIDRVIKPSFADATFLDETRPPFEDDVVRYYGQYVALAVADTFEEAKAAADAVAVTYATETPDVDPHLIAETTKMNSERGDADAAFAGAPVRIDARYEIASETHNPIETHATVAVWDGDELTLYETSQGVVNHRNVLAADARPAAGQGAGDQPVHRLWVRQQAVSLDAVAARGGGGDGARTTRQAGAQPADDVPRRRPPAPHRAALPTLGRPPTASWSRSSTTT